VFDPEIRSEAVAGVSDRLAALFGINARFVVERRALVESLAVGELPLDTEGE